MNVTSADGTNIGCHVAGSGPPLLLVHGASSDGRAAWQRVIEPLSRQFTVYAMDRRGRGLSGDTGPYAIEREYEDIATVVDAIDEPVNVFGQSYGALCALEAARLTSNIRRLVLYEGDMCTARDELYPTGAVEAVEERLAEGDRDGVLVTLYREVVRMPEDDLDHFRSQPEWWEPRKANALTVPRELRADRDYQFDAARFRDLGVPTLLLVGGVSPPHSMSDAETLRSVLPDARIRVLEGQGHTAHLTAPDLLMSSIVDFLTSP